MKQLVLPPIRSARGTVRLPGSKSLSNRVLLLAAQAEGRCAIDNLLDSDDVRHMLRALDQLGVDCALSEDRRSCVVKGRGGTFGKKGTTELFLGNAGTAMRPVCAALCAGRGVFTLTGEPRMYERPIGDLVGPLRRLGARIDYLGEEGFPPLRIEADGLSGGRVEIDGGVSSQFLTALLMAAPLARGPVEIEVRGDLVSKPYIEITLDTLRRFGVEVAREGFERFRTAPRTLRAPERFLVEGDASSASYFLALGAVAGGPVRVVGVGEDSVQGDARFAETLAAMGAKVSRGPDWIEVERDGPLRGIDVDLNHIPDAAMTIATTALFAEGPTAIRNVWNWRVKETDRLAAMATELRKVGAAVVEGEDFIEITPPARLRPAEIDTYDDHRMAMCFSLCARGDASITINDPDCVAKTFPDYFEVLSSLTVGSRP